ncbi:MAG: putative baseplate assembly protein [Anaerolineales bacterium]
MPLPDRPLDDRSFQDLVDEAKKRIPLYCPEWTDHNVSDPGVTLIELFAWMMDILLYRLNQVPRKHYVKLLELLGIQLQPPRAAQVPLTFYLSAPQAQPVVVARGTAAAASRAGSSTATATPSTSEVEAPVFTTVEDLAIQPARLTHLIARRRLGDQGLAFHEIALQRLESEFRPFSGTDPQRGEALYFGLDGELHRHYLGLELDCLRAGGLNIVPENPPLVWQAWAETGWVNVDIEQDGTGGLSWAGQVRMHLPHLARTQVNGIEAYWVRCEVTAPTEGQRPYATSPIIRGVQAMTWGATVDAMHATEVIAEPLGRSDGSPGQVFQLAHAPVLPRGTLEHIEIWHAGLTEWEAWREVDSFAETTAEDRCYVLDSATGEVTFGPALRQRDGTVRSYGAIPPRGSDLRMSRYRYGGGISGNVQAGMITELRSAIPYVARVANRTAASGGWDPEDLETAMFRARHELRTRYRAVSPDDFEFLVLQQFQGRVARARCLQAAQVGRGAPSPGQVYVVIVPSLSAAEADGYIPLPKLALPSALQAELADFLDERRLLTTQLAVREAGYKRVRVQTTVAAQPGVDQRRLQADVLQALNRFLNPLIGGAQGSGWPFGRELYLSDLYTCIQHVPGLLNVQELQMAWLDENDQPHLAERRIELLAHEVIVSDIHSVTVEAGD